MTRRLVLANGIPTMDLGFEFHVGQAEHPILVYLDHLVKVYPDFADVTYFAYGDLAPDLVDRMKRGTPRTQHMGLATVEITLNPVPPGPVLAITTADVGGCTSTVTSLAWKAIFAQEPPPTLRVPLKPIYSVTKERILQRSLKFYKNLQNEVILGDLISPKIMESLWPYVFRNVKGYPGVL